jgi:Fe2+ transport system protein FeoA
MSSMKQSQLSLSTLKGTLVTPRRDLKLDTLQVEEEAIIESLIDHPEIAGLTSKLMDMGLYPGKKIRVIFKAPFGDPIAIDVEGYTLSLRKKEASLIQLV